MRDNQEAPNSPEPTKVPDAAIEAAREISDPPRMTALRILEAAMPHIREMIADEIEDNGSPPLNCRDGGYELGIDDAARIARRGRAIE